MERIGGRVVLPKGGDDQEFAEAVEGVCGGDCRGVLAQG